MSLAIRRIHPVFVGEVSGVDLTRPLSAAAVAAIEAGIGMPMPEARILLRDLTEHATQPAFVYVHHWRPWDLVMWDNRRTMHRVRRYDERQPRDMRRTTLAGDAPTTVQEHA